VEEAAGPGPLIFRRKRAGRDPMKAKSTWRIAADAEREQLRDELNRLPDSAHDKPDYKIANARLQEARKAIEAPYGLHWWQLFYSGARIEQTWACLHEAGRALVMLLDQDALRAQVVLIREIVETHIDADAPARTRALAALEEIGKDGAVITTGQREQIRAILVLAHDHSDLYQREVRAFRNLLLVFSLLLGVLLVAVAVVHLIDSSLISLCTSPDPSLKGNLCPNGGAEPGRFDVAEVELVGALGGLLAAVIRLAKSKRLPGPYGLAVAQSTLKVVTGATTAFVGVLLLQKGVLAGLSRQSGSSVLAYAAFFGLAQQALTVLVDRRASELAETPAPKPATPAA
jgi:hypothetical protein